MVARVVGGDGLKLSGSISEFQFAGNEWLFQVERANVIHEAIENGGATESTARSVPVGTFGFDQISNEWFEQLSNEKRRPLQPDEVMAMATSEIAPARGALRSVWVGSVLVVLAGIWIFVRRKRRRGSHV